MSGGEIVFWIVGAAFLAAGWALLMLLPFRLVHGVLHKWGLHTHCGRACEHNLAAERVTAAIQQEFRKGMRQGMRGALTFGDQETRKMVADFTLLPTWKLDGASVGDFKARVLSKYNELAQITDASDSREVWASALAVALGNTLAGEPRDSLRDYLDIVRNTAAPEPEPEVTESEHSPGA